MRPGAPSVNPSGRPKGAKAIRSYIESNTNNGLDIIDALLAFARDPKSPKREAKEVWIHLLDRLVGKPETSSSIALSVEQRPVGEVLLAMPPSARLQFLDELRARKQLGPGYEEQGTEHAETD